MPTAWRFGLAGVALALLAAWHWAGIRQADAAGYRRGAAEVQGRWDAERVRMHAVAASAAAAARAEEQRRVAAQKEIEDAHQAELQRLRADAAIADAAAGRLRQRVLDLIAAARRDSAGSDPAAGPGGPAAADAGLVLADVLGQCVARVRQLAELADQRGAAGISCQRQYDALTAAQ